MVSFVITPIKQATLEGGTLSFSIDILNPNYQSVGGSYRVYWRTINTKDHIASASDYQQITQYHAVDFFPGPVGQSQIFSIKTTPDTTFEGDEYFSVALYDYQFNYMSEVGFTIQDTVPDLDIKSFSPLPQSNAVTAGQSVSLQAVVENLGTLKAGAFWTAFYLSPTPTFDLTDPRVIKLGSAISLLSLDVNAAKSVSTDAVIPANLQPGQYWIGIIADYPDDVKEVRNDNNSYATAITVIPAHVPTASFAITAVSSDKKEGDPKNDDVASGKSTFTPFTFEVTREGDLPASNFVNWSIVYGGATPGDFDQSSGTVAFGDNGTKVLTINVKADLTVEGDEAFSVQLSPGGSNSVIAGTGQANGVIQDDDTYTVLNPLSDYVDDGSSVTPCKLVDVARTFIGEYWGDEDCPGLLWAIAYEASGGGPRSSSIYDFLGTSASAILLTAPSGQTRVKSYKQDHYPYTVPEDLSGGDKTGDAWGNMSPANKDWQSIVQKGDFVRITGGGDGHSFIVTEVDQIGDVDPEGKRAATREIWVIDNSFGPYAGEQPPDYVKIVEHRLDDHYQQVVDSNINFIFNPNAVYIARLQTESPGGSVTLSSGTGGKVATGSAAQPLLTITHVADEIVDWFAGASAQNVIVQDAQTHNTLLTATNFTSLSFEAGSYAYNLTLGPLDGTDLSQDPVHFDGGPSPDSLNGAGADRPLVASGGDGADSLTSGKRNDQLSGDDGNDTLRGGDGDDTLMGGMGQDFLYGGTGKDTFVLTAAGESPVSAPDFIYDFATGTDKINIGGVYGPSSIVAISTDGTTSGLFIDRDGDRTWDDEISFYQAAIAPDDIEVDSGGTGVGITIFGTSHDDQIQGSKQGDVIYAGSGGDVIQGGLGQDLIFGGDGADRFVVQSADESTVATPDFVYDFESGTDIVDLRPLYAPNAKLALTRQGTDSYIYIDLEGDATWDSIVGFANAHVQARDVLVAGPEQATPGANIYGTDGDDIFVGGAGNDTFSGGTGMDTVVLSGQRSAYAVSAVGHGLAAILGPDGYDILSDIEKLQFDNGKFNLRNVSTSDLDADGCADLLLQYSDSSLAAWMTSGLAFAGGGLVGQPGTAWHARDLGDFGNGNADILMQRDSGEIAVWWMHGQDLQGGQLVGSPGASWRAVAAADFDGDGAADILLQHADSSIAVWLTRDGGFAGGGVVGQPGAAWRAVGAGDFDGDGKADIALQRDSGEIAIWNLDGFALSGGGGPGNPGPAWHVRATGDFDGDGKTDLLLQADDSRIAVWLMDGFSLRAAGLVGTPGSAWHVKGAVDFDGDGKADIALQRDSGEIAAWKMSGIDVLGTPLIGNPGANWSMIAPTGG